MKRLHLIIKGGEEDVGAADHQEERIMLALCTLDTSLLFTHSEELRRLADLQTALLPLVVRLKSILEEMQGVWRSSVTDFEEKVHLLNKHLIGTPEFYETEAQYRSILTPSKIMGLQILM